MSELPLRRRPRPENRRARRSPRRVAVRALLASAAAGPLVGLLWWLLSPGGARPAGDTVLTVVQSRGATDAVYALACLVAGSVAGMVWILLREPVHDARAVARLVGLLLGGLVGATLAWLTGFMIDVLAPTVAGAGGAAAAADDPPSLSGAVVAGALLWPLAVGTLVGIDTVRELVWLRLGGQDSRPG